jgi:hypothetical protein
MTNQAISPQQFSRMVEIAASIGDNFALEPDREKVKIWLDMARHELVDELDPIDRATRGNLALQLPFCFEVRTLSDRLVSSAPE